MNTEVSSMDVVYTTAKTITKYLRSKGISDDTYKVILDKMQQDFNVPAFYVRLVHTSKENFTTQSKVFKFLIEVRYTKEKELVGKPTNAAFNDVGMLLMNALGQLELPYKIKEDGEIETLPIVTHNLEVANVENSIVLTFFVKVIATPEIARLLMESVEVGTDYKFN